MKQASRKMLLMTPGPVPLHPDVQSCLSLPMIHHRTPVFDGILKSTLEKLKKIFITDQPCFMLTSTGSGAMEASIINVLAPQERVLAIDSGKFGQRWAEMAKVFGAQVDVLSVPWGQSVDIEDFKNQLVKSGPYHHVLCQACETSTGVLHPIKELSKIIRDLSPDTLFLIDAITALGATPLLMDDWDLDCVIGGSQKAFMLPTGLSYISFSKRAWSKIENNPTPRYYFDIRKEHQANQRGETFFSSNVNLIRATEKSLDLILATELDKHLEVINQRAQFTRNIGITLGLEPFTQSPSPSVTALVTPFDGQKFRQHLEDKYQLIVMGGQDQAKGKIIRIGHMGYILMQDMIEMADRLYFAIIDFKQPVPCLETYKQVVQECLTPLKEAYESIDK